MRPKTKKNTHKNTFKQETDQTFDVNEDIKVSRKWFEEILEGSQKVDKKVSDQVLIELKNEAKSCYDSECLKYNSKNSKTNSDYQWMKTILSKGTISDKIAAYTVSIQDNPLYNLSNLKNMVNMIKAKKDSKQLIDILTELFLSDLLHPKRKLKQFQDQPLSSLSDLSSGNAVTRRRYLIYWYFEDQLKETYASFVLALNEMARDTIDANKENAVGAIYKLLAGNAEQEKNLLAYIVNKLGDPSQKVASKVIYSLTQLLRKHPNMQGVVLLEVEKLLFRPNISKRAQYYALCFLSQYYLSHEESEIAKRLIVVYFSFFKACIKQGDVDSRMMSVLLSGVNRACPYAKLELEKVSEHIDAMYKIVHIANFNVSINALCLLFQISDYSNSVNDRFYSALYKKLLDPEVCHTNHQTTLLNLVYKALRRDTEKDRVKVFIKRLLQIAAYVVPAISCGILFLVSHLIRESNDLKASVLKPSTILDDEEVDEEEKYVDIKDLNEETTVSNNINEETLTEKNADVPDSELKINSEENEESKKFDAEDASSSTGWVHRNTNQTRRKHLNRYDPINRNPLYGGGEFCAYLELVLLKSHFHPTVSLFANQILNGEEIKYTGDPLKDFMLIRFLDRFAFKNPKKTEDVEKKGCHPTFGKRDTYLPKGIKSVPIKSAAYLNETEKNIPSDERFLYLYLQKKKKEKQPAEDNDDSDIESVASDEFEEMLDKMTGHKEEDDDLDYMGEIGENLKQKAKASRKKDGDDIHSDEEAISNDDEESMDSDNDAADSDTEELANDEDLNNEDKDLIEGLSDEDGASDIEFNSDDDSSFGKRLNKSKTKKDIQSLFASAEEFASILEDEGSAKVAPGSAHALANKDNADLKQLAWEEKRNRWVKGFNNNKAGKKRKGPNAKYNNKGNKRFKKK